MGGGGVFLWMVFLYTYGVLMHVDFVLIYIWNNIYIFVHIFVYTYGIYTHFYKCIFLQEEKAPIIKCESGIFHM